MKRSLSLVVIVTLVLWVMPRAGTAQETTAERTDYAETSSYDDVMAFLTTLQRSTTDIRVGVLARSTEGRDIPWVLAARPMVDGPIAAHRSGKPILYIQGNIHAGEVEGKEAAQMLLRDMTIGPLAGLLDSVILLVVPIYNPDGNDHFGPGTDHRPGQNGPPLVGLRPNGQGLDLNRDYVKMEAPETRGAARFINVWDPDFFIDLHTTNGSYHGYSLTYSPGLNPNGSAANDYVSQEFLPTVRSRVRDRHGQEMFWYGNFRNQDPDSLIQGWYTYDARPRFGTNWFAMRGRMAILSEAYSNAPFEERVAATYAFLREIIGLAIEDRDRIAAILKQADWARPEFVAVTAKFAPPDTLAVIAEITESDQDGTGPFARRKQTGVYRTLEMPVYHRFDPGKVVAVPAGYLVPPSLPEVVDLLRRQGVSLERLDAAWTGAAEVFQVDSVAAAARPFQGHRAVSVSGDWVEGDATVLPGWHWVSTDQRLGVLAAYLLEPASADGVVTWNLVDRMLRPGSGYPILRLSHRPQVETTLIDFEPEAFPIDVPRE